MADLVTMTTLAINGERYSVGEVAGAPFVNFASLCRPLRLDPNTEWKRVTADGAISTRVVSVEDANGNATRVAMLAVRHIKPWLLLHVREEQIPSDLRAKYRQMRDLAVRIITDFDEKGVAVNERVVGEEAAKRIEAMAIQAKAEYLKQARELAAFAMQHCSSDERTAALARVTVRRLLGETAGDTAGDTNTPLGVEQIALLAGVRLIDPQPIQFGQLVSREYKRRYGERAGRSEMVTVDSPAGKGLAPRVYYKADWPWIQDLARKFAGGAA